MGVIGFEIAFRGKDRYQEVYKWLCDQGLEVDHRTGGAIYQPAPGHSTIWTFFHSRKALAIAILFNQEDADTAMLFKLTWL